MDNKVSDLCSKTIGEVSVLLTQVATAAPSTSKMDYTLREIVEKLKKYKTDLIALTRTDAIETVFTGKPALDMTNIQFVKWFNKQLDTTWSEDGMRTTISPKMCRDWLLRLAEDEWYFKKTKRGYRLTNTAIDPKSKAKDDKTMWEPDEDSKIVKALNVILKQPFEDAELMTITDFANILHYCFSTSLYSIAKTYLAFDDLL